MKRARLTFTVALSCLLLGTLGLVNLGTAHADQATPPPGQAVACEQHATNPGHSHAKGLVCPSTTASLTATISPGTFYPGYSCDLTVSGTGLEPGTFLYYTGPGVVEETPLLGLPLGNYAPIVVGADGTVNATTFFYGNWWDGTLTLSATTAKGGTITTTFSPTC